MKSFSVYLKEDATTTTTKLPAIYLDMDETIVDWMVAADRALAAAGLPKWRDPYWKQFSDEDNDKVRWGAVNAIPDFWEKLEFSSEGKKIWNFVKKYKPYILSACGPHAKYAKPGKIKWISANLGTSNLSGVHLVRSHDKKNYAKMNGKPTVLIDDYSKNCREFEGSGGIAIQTTTASEVISKLKKLGFR